MKSFIRYVPLIETLRNYKREDLRFDIIAALTVAVVALPQSMAYAMIAGVNPAYGLYTFIVLTILGSAFGSSHHLNTGPTNAIALLIAGYMSVYLGQDNFYGNLFLLTFMVGAIQFAMGVLNLGKLVNYVSHSVIVGFTAGAGVIIAMGQLNSLLGISLPKGKLSSLEKVIITFQHIDQTNMVALGLGIFTILVTVFAKKINKNLPGALLGIIFSVILVMALGLDKYHIKLAGNIPSAIPPFTMINFDPATMAQLFSGALTIAIIGLVEAVSISKAIAAQTQQKIDSNQEFIGQGIANMGGAFLSCFAGSGSFTRSAVTFQNGGRTRLANILSGVVVLIILFFLAPYAKYIPNASLAGVIMVVAYSMIDKKAVAKVFKANRNDAIVMLVTCFTTILAPELEYAIYAGIAISILLYLRDTGSASVRKLAPVNGDPLNLVEAAPTVAAGSNISVVQLEGNLYFGSSADLEEKLNQAYDTGSKVYVLRFNGVTGADVTALEVIENFIHRALKENRKVLICDVRPAIFNTMQKMHIVDLVGRENIFLSEQEVMAASSKALDKANAWLREELDLNLLGGQEKSMGQTVTVS
ncbi:MAG: SulP family inorganic anion transporter [Bacillota bacterium]|uniref:SulP family inorganic anion transporter n=1 Tax=Desulfurispora thermophila TaxID=265470 RepID=UPI00035E5B3F|nr:SulP family inorganic anion transporter [Desulfurispora thermophila]